MLCRREDVRGITGGNRRRDLRGRIANKIGKEKGAAWASGSPSPGNEEERKRPHIGSYIWEKKSSPKANALGKEGIPKSPTRRTPPPALMLRIKRKKKNAPPHQGRRKSTASEEENL